MVAAASVASPDSSVGVDVSRMSFKESEDDLFGAFEAYITPNEWIWIKSFSTAKDRIRAFYAIWTLKESWVKALGDGLEFGLGRLEVQTKIVSFSLLDTDKPYQDFIGFVDGVQDCEWTFELEVLDETHVASVCCDHHQKQGCLPSESDILQSHVFKRQTPSEFLEKIKNLTI